MAITITLDGDQTIVEAGVDAFAKQNGWEETVFNEEGNEVANPVSKLEYAEGVLRAYFRETITAWNIKQAETAAREQAKAQTESSLDQTSISVSVTTE